MKYFLLIWMLCPLASLHAAGPGIRIACYNAESLHDTIPDRLIDDGDYTPRGNGTASATGSKSDTSPG